jgi:hypothetical protein
LETYLLDLKNGENATRRFSKALDSTPTNLLSNRSEEFDLTDFEKLSEN